MIILDNTFLFCPVFLELIWRPHEVWKPVAIDSAESKWPLHQMTSVWHLMKSTLYCWVGVIPNGFRSRLYPTRWEIFSLENQFQGFGQVSSFLVSNEPLLWGGNVQLDPFSTNVCRSHLRAVQLFYRFYRFVAMKMIFNILIQWCPKIFYLEVKNTQGARISFPQKPKWLKWVFAGPVQSKQKILRWHTEATLSDWTHPTSPLLDHSFSSRTKSTYDCF